MKKQQTTHPARALSRSIRRVFTNRRSTRALLLTWAILTIFATASAVYYRYQSAAQTQPKASDFYSYKAWAKGDIIENKDIAFTLSSTRTSTQAVPQFWPLPEGHHYVMATVSFKNKTNAVYELSPITSMYLADSNGTQYPVTGAPFSVHPVGGPVAAGQTMSGEVAFTVPDNASNLSFFFRPYLPSSAPIWITNLE